MLRGLCLGESPDANVLITLSFKQLEERLADVVEALIMAIAQACLHRFFLELDHFTNDLSSILGRADCGTSHLITHSTMRLF